VQHRQEAKVAAAEERERAAAETAAMVARTARLAMVELAAVRAEVEAERQRMQRVAPTALFLPTTTKTTSSS
jgi:hypothetical protein